VAHPGTFEGIVEKIPYLKQLGITAVELMPCYEFDEAKIKPLYSDHREQEETKQKEEEGKKEVQDGTAGASKRAFTLHRRHPIVRKPRKSALKPWSGNCIRQESK
jgi:hypothetical protein